MTFKSFRQSKPVPSITITTSPGQVSVSWAPGQILEQAPTITGHWTVVVGATPAFTVNTSSSQFFFRVRTPPVTMQSSQSRLRCLVGNH